jgi:TrmH family RNA methyltransferase
MGQSKSRNYIPKSSGSTSALTKAELTQLVSLKNKKGRRLHQRFLAEGVRLLEEALKRKIKPQIVFYYEPELSERGQEPLAAFRARKVETQTLSSRDFHRLADTEQPQGLIAVFSMPDTKFGARKLASGQRALILENLSDPGNVGSIIRSAVGFGFDPILLLRDCVEPFNPKLVRATAGAIFSTKLYEISLEDLARQKSETGLRLLVTDLGGKSEEQWLTDNKTAKSGPLGLVIGSESEGVSPELLTLADERIRITHSPRIESLNAATAAAIVMHRIYTALEDTTVKPARKTPAKRKSTKTKK